VYGCLSEALGVRAILGILNCSRPVWRIDSMESVLPFSSVKDFLRLAPAKKDEKSRELFPTT
jgi:hypothetical protein